MSVKAVMKLKPEAKKREKVRLLSLLRAMKNDAEKFKTSEYKASYIDRFNKLRDAVIKIYENEEGSAFLQKTVKNLTPEAHWPTIIGALGQSIAFIENDLEGLMAERDRLKTKVKRLVEEKKALNKELQELRIRIKFIK